MKIPSELAKFGLEYAKPPVRRRIILTSEGGPGVGKTHIFYASAPRPALVIQLDMNDEGLRENYDKDLDILFKTVVVPPFITHDEVQRLKDMSIYTQLRDLYNLSVTKDYFRSIMIDEGWALYTLVRRAFLTDLSFGGASQPSYAPINSAMDRFYTLAKQHRTNLYIPHRQTDEREVAFSSGGKKTSVPTGGLVAAGWKQSLYASQCHLLLGKDPAFNPLLCSNCELPRNGNGKARRCACAKFGKRNPIDKFEATIIKCTANTRVEGMMLQGDDINWATLGQLIFPATSEEDWK